MIVCAVPFLRDRDVMKSHSYDDSQTRQENLIKGICEHYKNVFDKALEIKGDSKIPLVATGHLFVSGGSNKGEEPRELYVGASIKIDLKETGIFPQFVNYVALGHLHSPQGSTRVRYSGSPIPMTFGEAERSKYVTIVEFDENCKAHASSVKIPVFRKLVRIKGDWNIIESRLNELIKSGESAWLEITYNGEELIDLKERVNKKLKFFPELEAISFYDETNERVNNSDQDNIIIGNGKNLDEILPEEIFKLKLNSSNIPDEQQNIFLEMYKEILSEINN